MKPVVIAQIGMMHDHATASLDALVTLTECYDFRGVCPITEQGRQKTEKYLVDHKDRLGEVKVLTLEEVFAIEGLEAVSIETEEELATEYAQMCADRGLALYIDKPGSASPHAFKNLIDTVKEKNLPFQMGYMYRFNPLYLKTLAMKEKGELGEVFSVEVHMSVHHSAEKRKWLAKHKGGMMYFLGCHDVDIIYRLMGEPDEVIPMNTSTGQDGVYSEDFGFCVFRYKNGVSFVKTSAAEYNGFDRRQLVVTGTKGTVEIRPFETYDGTPAGKLLSRAHITTDQNEGNIWRRGGEDIVSELFTRYDAMMRHFARQVRGERDSVYTPDYEWELFKLNMRACGISV